MSRTPVKGSAERVEDKKVTSASPEPVRTVRNKWWVKLPGVDPVDVPETTLEADVLDKRLSSASGLFEKIFLAAAGGTLLSTNGTDIAGVTGTYWWAALYSFVMVVSAAGVLEVRATYSELQKAYRHNARLGAPVPGAPSGLATQTALPAPPTPIAQPSPSAAAQPARDALTE